MSDKPKGISTRQIVKYAKDNGFDSVKFSGKNGNYFFVGKFLDAYFEFVQIPALGDGFVTIDQIETELGYDIKWDVLDEEEYETLVEFERLVRNCR